MPTLKLYNTLTRRKEDFHPIDPANIRMYVCGPTVYDRPHLGNARSVVVYDVLYRLLKQLYGEKHVTYVRNITDVDDKINAAAKANNEPISALTRRVEGWFHADMEALNVLPATCALTGSETPQQVAGCMGEPHATRHIPHMIALIENLIENGNAYVSDGHVLFAVGSYREYGALSGRRLDELVAGARVEVESYKKHPGDFVLWKPAEAGDDASSVFDSPWGKGRPGWHIECSAMSTTYLGAHFDIHGGGADLMFPHHENEIAQSRCALPGSQFANVWVHNGFLTVGGEKMSKSLGNFTTVRDLLDKGIKGEIIRFALLSAKYNEPLDWNEKLLEDSKKALDRFYLVLRSIKDSQAHNNEDLRITFSKEILAALCDDLNFPLVTNCLHEMATNINNAKDPSTRLELGAKFILCMRMLGFFSERPTSVSIEVPLAQLGVTTNNPYISINPTLVVTTSAGASGAWFGITTTNSRETENIQRQIDARIAAKKAKNWPEADRIRKELADQGVMLEDRPDGSTDWRRA